MHGFRTLAATAVLAVAVLCLFAWEAQATQIMRLNMGLKRPLVSDVGFSLCDNNRDCASLKKFSCSSLDGPDCGILSRKPSRLDEMLSKRFIFPFRHHFLYIYIYFIPLQSILPTRLDSSTLY